MGVCPRFVCLASCPALIHRPVFPTRSGQYFFLFHCANTVMFRKMAGVGSSGWALVRGLCRAVQAARPHHLILPAPLPLTLPAWTPVPPQICVCRGARRTSEAVGDGWRLAGGVRRDENSRKRLATHTTRTRARPVRRSRCSRCSSSCRRQNSKIYNFIHARRWPCAVQAKPGPITQAERGQDSQEGNPDYNPRAHAP
jgi:hypothetical protein